MQSDGTVTARKFINFPVEKDHLYHILNRIKKKQRQHGRTGGKTDWKIAMQISDELSKKIASSIVSSILKDADAWYFTLFISISFSFRYPFLLMTFISG